MDAAAFRSICPAPASRRWSRPATGCRGSSTTVGSSSWVSAASPSRRNRQGATSGRDGLALQPAVPHPWLPAFSPQGEALPLECLVASFSQPGPLVNRALTEAAGSLLDAEGIDEATWCEWGAGYGNLTAWCSRQLGPRGTALEADPRAVTLLQRNASRYFPDVRTVAARVESTDEPPAADLWLIDPPRNGFAPLLRRLPDLSKTHRDSSWRCIAMNGDCQAM